MRELAQAQPKFKEIIPPAKQLGNIKIVEKLPEVALGLFFALAIIASLLMIIFSGIQWTMSGGDPEKLAKAKRRLTFALVGFMVILLSFVILKIIGTLFGVDLTRVKL